MFPAMNLAQFCYTIVSSVCFHDCILGMASVSAGLWSSKDGCFCGDMLVRGESWMLPMRACFGTLIMRFVDES